MIFKAIGEIVVCVAVYVACVCIPMIIVDAKEASIEDGLITSIVIGGVLFCAVAFAWIEGIPLPWK